MRKIFDFFMILFFSAALMIGASAAAVRTDWFWKTASPVVFNHFGPGWTITEMDYGRKDILWPGVIRFHHLSMTLKLDQAYFIKADELSFNNFWMLVRGTEAPVVKALGVSLQSEPIKAQDCRINAAMDFSHLQLETLKGDAACRQLQLAGNSFSNFAAQLDGTAEWLKMKNISTRYLNGPVEGEVAFGFSQALSYVFDLRFHDLALDENMFDGSVIGVVNGTFQANGFADRLNNFEIVMDAPSGAKIKSGLLQSLVPYLPAKSDVRKRLEKAIAASGYVYYDTGHAVFRKSGVNTASADIHLTARELNVILNPVIDVNIEGGLQSVFEMLEFFLNPKGQEES